MVPTARISRITSVALVAALLVFAAPTWAAEHGGGESSGHGGEGGNPSGNPNLNPDAVLLNARNPLAVHAGPGKPNVGSVYLPPSLSGKDKKAKSGQTEQKVMGEKPAHSAPAAVR